MTRAYLTQELATALQLARRAGDAIMGLYPAGLAVQRKAGDEPVTEADRVADAIIAGGLRAAFPQDGLLTEESEDDRSRLGKERVWIVDPLDGTTEFIGRTGEFSVHIALAIGGLPALGVVAQPARERVYYAVRGQGAYLLGNGRAERLRVSAERVPARMRLVVSRSHASPFVEAARRALGIIQANRAGSVGIKVSLVAQGAYDLYLATTISKEWDFCAPHALLAEAGGTMTDLCGTELAYNKADVSLCTGLVASNGRAHAEIVDALLRVRP
ncbi:MAG TPA: 3'(2'),5'-bisphosphate nucleotidase CysQ [Anaerolineae bacterium]|nr:3'(2'),5'-bisphosphate nucleotidase CysQ [Anaerolineae bacterium]